MQLSDKTGKLHHGIFIALQLFKTSPVSKRAFFVVLKDT